MLKSQVLLLLSITAFVGCTSKPVEQKNEVTAVASIDREPSAEIAKREYQAAAVQVQGDLKLVNNNGQTIPLRPGKADLDLKSANLFFNPIKAFRGDRVLVIASGADKFSFRIPNELIFKDQRISVHQKFAEQNAHLNIKETLAAAGSYEEDGTASCTYSGTCSVCETDTDGEYKCGPKFSNSCSGSRRVRYKVDLYNRALTIEIFNDTGRANIQTPASREVYREIIKNLSPCG